MNLIGLPFENLVRAMLGLPVPYPATPLSFAYVITLLVVYYVGLFLAWRRGDIISVAFSAPFMIFLAVYQAWFFIPRYIALCFPALLGYRHLLNGRAGTVILALAMLLAIGGSFYSIYSLYYLGF